MLQIEARQKTKRRTHMAKTERSLDMLHGALNGKLPARLSAADQPVAWSVHGARYLHAAVTDQNLYPVKNRLFHRSFFVRRD